MNKDAINLVKDSTSTFLNIAQMAQYKMKYAQKGDAEDKEKMYKHAFLAGAGTFTLLAIGIAGLVDSRTNYNRNLSR